MRCDKCLHKAFEAEGQHCYMFKDAVEGDCGQFKVNMTLRSLQATLRKCLDDHIRLASKYERKGDVRRTVQLRAVANLIGAILRGDDASPVCPDTD